MENQEQDLRTIHSDGPKAQLERIAGPSEDGPSEEATPAVDAWLERRLRVFERALAGLEARQEKAERDLTRRIAVLEEKLAAYEMRQPVTALEFSVTAEPKPLHEAPAPAPVATAPEPQRPMSDFLAHARRAAISARPPLAHPPKAQAAPRWMAWTAVGCAAAMSVTALALGTVAGATENAGATSHRQTAQAFGRVIALADSGDPRDQTVVAYAYLRGQHQAADHEAAGRWALAAAERGDPMAQYLLAALYQAGDGVAADPVQAFHWFEASALRGNLKAMHNLAIAFDQGQGTERNPERAAAWFNRAALQGYKDSQFDLAVLYERGDGVMQNPARALKWYLIAALGGDMEANARAKELEQAMNPADVGEAETEAARFVPASHDLAANNL